ncbi:hypothetical protein B0T25DRAFT_512555 [Lasiosphaeria hispida]|uniref:Uncharacterized protein n=1 Tax=Lasiosphaeria hispida TaxID=260671 RepID=A0AAJ0HTJ0_9PEZI|nr:hypothetical protein B0T25DRAFT_512555 [Lasiosphaeria hispida]
MMPSEPVVAKAMRLAKVTVDRQQPAGTRSLGHITMGFKEIEEWKAQKDKVTKPSGKPETITDIKVSTPIRKSSVWNISYDPEDPAAATSSMASALTSTPSKSARQPSIRFGGHRWSREQISPPSLAANITTARPKASKPATTASLTNPCPETEPIFGPERTTTQIDDVPNLSVLGKLRPESGPKSTRDYIEHILESTALAQKPVILWSAIGYTSKGLQLLHRLAEVLALTRFVKSDNNSPSTPSKNGALQGATLPLLEDVLAERVKKERVIQTPVDKPQIPKKPSTIGNSDKKDSMLPSIPRQLPLFLGGGPF